MGKGLRFRATVGLAVAGALLVRAMAATAGQVDDRQCMAMTLYWEARDEGRAGMIAVGYVVLNRIKSRKFPDDVCTVVKQGGESPPCQFSYWCDGKHDEPAPGKQWNLAQKVAEELLSHPPGDPTGGALFFHSVEDSAPWQKQRRRTAKIGDHIYYK
jgi:N-acetylmuramoyl-L-alanine amidase